MSAEIVNLRQARKQKTRKERERAAEDNRRKFGRTKAEKLTAKREREDLERRVDGHRLTSTQETQDGSSSSEE